MELKSTTVKLNGCPIAPRKMSLVVDSIRGERVVDALNLLKFQSKAGSPLVEKLLLSAIASWEEKNPDVSLEDADLFIKEAFVCQGKTLKRFRPAPQGRAHRIRKRSNHVTLVVDALNAIDLAQGIEEAEVVEDAQENDSDN